MLSQSEHVMKFQHSLQMCTLKPIQLIVTLLSLWTKVAVSPVIPGDVYKQDLYEPQVISSLSFLYSSHLPKTNIYNVVAYTVQL